MPGPNGTDDGLEPIEEVEESTEEAPEEGAESGEDAAKSKGDKTDKRISDLQSARDAETARANKAEAALKARDAGKSGVADPVTNALMQEVREASLDAIYGEHPELRDYGIERSLIEGSTRAQMRESADAVVSLIKSVSTKVRNEVLAENGIVAAPSGSSRKSPVDYASMDDEAFKKLLDTTF
jgi:hypothetical protein